tara:strand:- start:2270 stop:3277 length:1008 start_codon:yes stop_codon:yes gene_type:complete
MNKLSECIINKNSSYKPVWFMRQAGRYLSEFREIRKNNQNFIKLCLNTKLTTEITLQPLNRFDLDAAIIFSDILMIPYGLGQSVEFKKGEGPLLGNLDLDEIINTNKTKFIKKINPVYEAISNVKRKIKNKSIIGFAGAPWTLLVYILNKKSPKKDFDFSKINKDKSLVNKLLKKLEEMICLHIEKQIQAGADVIQIFDSWAGLLPKNELDKYCYAPTQRIINQLRSKGVPIICFPKGIGKNYQDFCSAVKPHCISIDYETDPEWAKQNLKGIPIQGGLDPKVLLKSHENIKTEVENYLNVFSDYPYIFNLGHGVLPETKPETINYVTNLVKNRK